MTELTQERLKFLLHYDPETGIFTWLVNRQRCCAGNRAGGVSNKKASVRRNYRAICIDGRSYYEHRLAVFYMTGSWPSDQVDHKDLDTTNNKWKNLRDASQSNNKGNTPPSRLNTSGYKGVHFHSKTQRWRAQIKLDGKQVYLGSFLTKEPAAEAYAARAKELFGEFARTG